MPRELTGAEESAWNRYQAFGTPDEIETQIRKLRREAAKYRTRNSELEEQVKGAPAVPDGGRVLSKEEAEEYAAITALGPAADIKGKLDAAEQAAAELDGLKRRTARDAAAKALGIEGNDLASFAGADALVYEVRDDEVEVGGQMQKRATAYVKDAEGKEHRLDAYGKQQWGRPFEAVLGARDQQQGQGTNGHTPFPRQSAGGAAPEPADLVAAHIERMSKAAAQRPNPLRPQTTT